MKQIMNPQKLQAAIHALDFHHIFSKDYSSEFLLFEFEKNELIIREGMINHYLYFISDGIVKCFSCSVSGKLQFLTYLKCPESIGIAGSIWGEFPKCSVQAIERCHCVALPLHKLRHELLEDVVFLRYLCRELTNTLSQNNHYLQVAQCSSVESKIASILLSVEKDGICQVDLSSAAEIAGTTYRHVLRILNKFCSNDILEKQKKNYLIKDFSYLQICSEDSFEYLSDQVKDAHPD